MRSYIPPHRRDAANVPDGSPTSRRSNNKSNQLNSAAPAPAPAYPPWVLLERYCTTVPRRSRIADKKTLAAGTTTTGHPIAVALCVAPPPEGSRVCVHLPYGVQAYSSSTVLAAHGDSVLINVPGIQGHVTDYFIYNAGDAAAVSPRPPVLRLLPPPPGYYLYGNGTGLLRRGEDEFMVAELTMAYNPTTMRKAAVLQLLRRSGEWSAVKGIPISHYSGGGEDGEDLESSWNNDAVVPVGDDLLCWADMSRGLIFSKVFDESPGLRYVPLPADTYYKQASYRNVCVTAGGGAVKFVNMFPRCCCGDAAHTFCRRSRRAYTVQTWTLRMDDMTWVKDGVLDAAQLWALDGYKGVPRVRLDCPVVSLDEPDTICFMVCEANHENDADKTTWVIMVDMRSKTLRSVFRYPRVRRIHSRECLRPSRISGYFNSRSSSLKPDDEQEKTVPSSLASKCHVEIELQTDDVRKPLLELQPPVKSWGAPMEGLTAASPEAMILAALEEIPGLDRDDMLKAYRILSHDDSGRRFRTLMGLPMNLRKDCVLLEIKASEACSICSSCSADLQL